MSKYGESKLAPTPGQQLAIDAVNRGNRIVDELVAMYRESMRLMYEQPQPFTVADLQEATDALPDAIEMFTDNAALRDLIVSRYPGSLEDDELSPPIEYTVDASNPDFPRGRIVWDESAIYPTQAGA